MANLVYRMRRKPVTRIVTFHDILPENLGKFSNNLAYLKQHTNVITFEQFFSDNLARDRINTIITFDDGYKSWVTCSLRILKKMELPATFFISSGFVGLSRANEIDYIRRNLFGKLGPRKISGGLTNEDVKRIAGEGFNVGGHTVNHCSLTHLRDGDRIRSEIYEDKIRLERLIGRKVNIFSYPGGDYSNPIIDIVGILKESGYEGAVTTISGINGPDSMRYLLRRELTDSSMPEQVFRAIVNGNHDAVSFVKQWAFWCRWRER